VLITGSINAIVQDNSQAVTGLQVLAIPPSGSVTYSQLTAIDGHAQFNPLSIEVGTWSFVIPAQTPRPYGNSMATMSVSAPNQSITFIASQPTVGITPTSNTSYTSTNGGIINYNLIYNQPGNLLVPVKLKFSNLPTNWTAGSSPVTIGFTNVSNSSLTVTGVNCVDQSPSFAVTTLDLIPTPTIRSWSDPQTIAKAFTSTVTVSWTTTGINNNFCGNGTLIGIITGHLDVSVSNACASNVAVAVSWNTGNCCYNSFVTPKGTIGAANCGGGSLQFGPGSYNCTVNSGATWGSINVSFNGVSRTVSFPTSGGGVQLLSTTY
jgi:hypothetical protein